MSMDHHFKSEAANVVYLAPEELDKLRAEPIQLLASDFEMIAANKSIPEAIYVVQTFFDHRANTAKFDAFYDEKLALACVSKAVEEGKLALLSRCVVTIK